MTLKFAPTPNIQGDFSVIQFQIHFKQRKIIFKHIKTESTGCVIPKLVSHMWMFLLTLIWFICLFIWRLRKHFELVDLQSFSIKFQWISVAKKQPWLCVRYIISTELFWRSIFHFTSPLFYHLRRFHELYSILDFVGMCGHTQTQNPLYSVGVH